MKLLKIPTAGTGLVLAILALAPCRAEVLVNGAGASFPNPMYSKWFSEYHKLKPDVQINYQPIGSGGGIKQVTEGTVDFGATDGPMNDTMIAEFQKKRGANVLHFPTVMGADVPAYNLPGVTAELNFSGDVLAGIFLGEITKWNDPKLAQANKGVKLPDSDIIVVHRSDGSGTTYVWVDFLSKVSPTWKSKVGVGTSVNWPVGLGGKGNDGVAGQIKQSPNSIGYVELVYAVQNKMQYGKVQNAAGQFVKADLASITAAAAGVKEMPEDFRVSITNAPGKTSYPVSSFTWLLIPDRIEDGNKKTVIVDFLNWMLTKGQELAAPLDYARLPASVVAREKKAIAKIK